MYNMKILVLVDVQNDMVTGPLGGVNQKFIIPRIIRLINQFKQNDDLIIATLDSHVEATYDKCREGKHFPTKHCIISLPGHQLIPEVKELIQDYPNFSTVAKIDSFGLRDMYAVLENLHHQHDYLYLTAVDEVEFHICGLMTNTSVLSVAVSLQNWFSNAEIYIHCDACASYDYNLHEKALDVMKSLQMNIV